MRFLDNYASSRAQAAKLGDDLGEQLSNISDNSVSSQIQTALALIKIRLAPVITIDLPFGRDNHSDTDLRQEVAESIESLEALGQYHRSVKQNNLDDQVNLATFNVFGRTHFRNSQGGRDHYGDMTVAILHGSGFQGGVIGGLETKNTARGPAPAATAINSVTGF